jgi:hypothetical protein
VAPEAAAPVPVTGPPPAAAGAASQWGRRALPWAVWAVYAWVLWRAVRRHEPWGDETHAWMLARENGYWQLMWEELRYEGSPGLWHTLLWGLSHAGLPVESMQWLGAASAALGVLLLVRLPLPWPLRVLAPFSYFLLYQYGAVARSYTLMAPLVFGIAWVWPRRDARLGGLVVLLALLANVSSHGLLMAGGIFAAHLAGLLAEGRLRERRTLARNALASLALLAVAGFVVLQLRLPPDATFVPPLRTDLRDVDGHALTALTEALGGYHLGTLALLAVSLAWFARRRVLALYLLATLGPLGVMAMKYRSGWHDGVLFLAWLLALAVSFQETPAPAAGPSGGRPREPLRLWVTAAAGAVLALHTWWSWCAWERDLRGPYTGAPAAARYLREHGLHERRLAGAGFWAWAVLPYFDRNIFINHHGGGAPAHWRWARRSSPRDWPEHIAADRPEWVLVGDRHTWLSFSGYVTEAVFPGEMFFKDRVYESASLILLRREDLPPPGR